jgi:hypothetical protein
MREPLCICWALVTSDIVSRAGAAAAGAGATAVTEGALEPVRPVPAPVFVADVVVTVVVEAAGLLTLLPILKMLKKRNGRIAHK